MLDHILGRVQNFEARHGITPNVVYLNHSHYAALREQCPGLFSEDSKFSLGFHLILVPDSELAHPRISWVPPRVKIGPESDQMETARIVEINHHRRVG